MINKGKLQLMKFSIGLIIVLVLSFIVTGCQPTPEEDIVVIKNQDAMLDAATNKENTEQSNLLPGFSESSEYSFNMTGANGKLNVSADAKVYMQDIGDLPTAEVVPGEFSQQMVSDILNHLFGDTPYYEQRSNGQDVMTKDEIQTLLISLKADIANGRYDDDEDLLEITLAHIEDLESSYDSAPETKEGPVLSDGIMWEVGDNGAKTIDVYSLDEVKGIKKASFKCSSGTNAVTSNGQGSIHYMDNVATGNIIFSMKGALRIYSDSDIQEELYQELGISLFDAKQLAQKFIEAAKATDMECRAAYVINDQGTGLVDGNTNEAQNYAIKLYYTRNIVETPVLVLGDVGFKFDENFDYTWPYEQLEITINKNGICDIYWNSPCVVSDLITESTNIFDFNKAQEIFEKMISVTYEAQTAYIFEEGLECDLIESLDISINEIELGLLRIKKQNTQGKKLGLYVPVWAFYGQVVYHYTDEAWEYGFADTVYNEGGAYPDGPYIVLAVNAIDGSIIDIELGY